MLLSPCILISQFSLPSGRRDPSCQTSCWTRYECGRAGVSLSCSRDSGQTAQGTDPAGSAEALQSSLSWHLLSWSTQGPPEAAAKWDVICSTMDLLQSRLQGVRKKDCPWPDGGAGTCLCLPWAGGQPPLSWLMVRWFWSPEWLLLLTASL